MRSVIRRSAWILGVGVVVIAMAGDDPRREKPPVPPSHTSPPLPPLGRPVFDLTELPVGGENAQEAARVGAPEDEGRGDDAEPLTEEPEDSEPSPAFMRKMEKRMEEIEKSIVPVSFEIPDDPPPHEGAMIDYPILIDVPDLVQVEILETNPGRPISGERLVRSDGTIDLEFYGSVYVRGLTPRQAKERVVLHMRKYVTDDVLGLIEDDFDTRYGAWPEAGPLQEEAVIPRPYGRTVIDLPLPHAEKILPEQPASDEQEDLRKEPQDSGTGRPKSTKSAGKPPRRTIHRAAQESAPEPPRQAQAVGPPVMVVPSQKGDVRITIEVRGDVVHPGALPVPDPSPAPVPAAPANQDEDWTQDGLRIVHPADTDRVFVAITAYNHTIYYLQGDVAAPGRLPFTGNETVLDALNYAGGLAPTADPANIKLIRPGRGGKPAKIYPIDYKAIVEQGDPKSNLQIFPGDRLIVGRHPTVQTTVALDRVEAILNTATSSILSTSRMAQNLRTAMQDEKLTPTEFRARVNAWVDLMWPLLEKGEAGVLDEKTFREAMIKAIDQPDAKPVDSRE